MGEREAPVGEREASALQGFGFEQLDAPPRRAPAPRLSDARARAAGIVAAAEAEAEQIRAAARAEGFQEGLADGRATAAEELRPAAGALVEAVGAVRELVASAAETVEAEAVTLALSIAEKVVVGSIEVQPERILDVVRGALRALVERGRLVVQVNPADLELVAGAVNELSGTLGGIEHLEVQEERRVARGGTLVRTLVGQIDATIETKLERARAALMEELEAG